MVEICLLKRFDNNLTCCHLQILNGSFIEHSHHVLPPNHWTTAKFNGINTHMAGGISKKQRTRMYQRGECLRSYPEVHVKYILTIRKCTKL